MRDYFIERITKSIKTLKKIQLICLLLGIILTSGVILVGTMNRLFPESITSIHQLTKVSSSRYVSIEASLFVATGNYIYEEAANEESRHILSREYLVTLDDGYVFVWSRQDFTEGEREVVFKGSVVTNPRYEQYAEELADVQSISKTQAKLLLSPYMIDIHSNEWYYLILIGSLGLLVGYFYCKPLLHRNIKILSRLEKNEDYSRTENFEETLIKDNQLLWSHSWVFNLNVSKPLVYHYNEAVWMYIYIVNNKAKLFIYLKDQQFLVVEEAVDEIYQRILNANPKIVSRYQKDIMEAYTTMRPKQWSKWIEEREEDQEGEILNDTN